ncbi:hypothetical protein BH10ACT8_BH10ACT8_11120 [soil metagenome]|jgi:hypothetical protein
MSEPSSLRSDPETPEARCDRCGEGFVIPEDGALLHFQQRNGELCGGTGVPFRKYVIRKPNRW